MKKEIIAIILIISCISGCSKGTDNAGGTELSISVRNSIQIGYIGGALEVNVTCNGRWTVELDSKWCSIDKSEDTGNESFNIDITPNNVELKRSVDITIKSGKLKEVVTITQDKFEGVRNLPVVFHVLHNNAEGNISSFNIVSALNNVNNYYSNSENNPKGTNTGISFYPAGKDPHGRELKEPGIHRVQWSETVMNPFEFTGKKSYYSEDIVWNPREYINIWIYRFDRDEIAGVSVVAFTPTTNYLPGTNTGDFFLDNDVDFVYGLSLNNLQTGDIDLFGKVAAHELGHYLGLLHVFSESSCNDTDYCNDTPNYDRKRYSRSQQYRRISCEGVAFTSDNVMDYYISYNNLFTRDQVYRMNFVLQNSPIIPGSVKQQNVKGICSYPEIRVIE